MKKHFKIKKGYDIPVIGSPDENIIVSKEVGDYGVLGSFDFHDIKQKILVKVGDVVKAGQPLFLDKKDLNVPYVSPVSGKVTTINRGEKRKLISVVVNSDGRNSSYLKKADLDLKGSNFTKSKIKKMLVKSGIWTSFKTRPFSKVPVLSDDKIPSIFVSTIDTNPLSICPHTIIKKNKISFIKGLEALAKLTDGKLNISGSDQTFFVEVEKKLKKTCLNVECYKFSGPHPAGNVGTHIHFIEPVSENKEVWSINYQDVINIGNVIESGELSFKRYIAFGGVGFKNPKIVETTIGASISELLENELGDENIRIVQGSILSGKEVGQFTSYLGRSYLQLSAIKNYTESRVLGWLIPWRDKISSVLNVHISSFLRKKDQDIDSGLNGSFRAIIPLGNYERLTPLDILPTPLLRSILVEDTDTAQKLGLLELDEEDVALFAYADIGKNDFLGALRSCLQKIEREG